MQQTHNLPKESSILSGSIGSNNIDLTVMIPKLAPRFSPVQKYRNHGNSITDHYTIPKRVIGAVVAQLLYTQLVTGSNPVSPT